ncbi:LysM peptidoglycan-binding domain-containing protein [Lelliottia nimipressuralis]|uniref:LysM peptidoglycan-binding domain-containing protein n=1 Tax=Lelliottia nimipressuralis TaxID=69220 RepID=A0ABD4KHP8_9ENTR|nr:LysM peptidoglycan-binding domain-containing protein [Lelliottia nimipressuralis]MBF4180342.1 LysM peptidoglycan-binding domain-containing protein [Lelliottia nimipressuralis]
MSKIMRNINVKYNNSSLTADFIADDGTHYLRSGGTICWRFFNPGNIRPSRSSVCDSLKIGEGNTKSGPFMIFPDDATGWKALKMLLKLTYKDMTVRDVIFRYSPKLDGNNPAEYVKKISMKTGIQPDEYIRDFDDVILERLMEAIKTMEGYYNNQETRRERTIPTTNILVSDGNTPIANEKLKVVIDNKSYEWCTNDNGYLPPIAHLPGRSALDIFSTGANGKEEKVYSAVAGPASISLLLIKTGQVFTATTGAHQEGERATEDYIVKSGDTLSKIAREFHTTVKRIADLNSISNVDVISVGQEIKLPGGISKPLAVKKQASQERPKKIPTGTSDNAYPQANVGNDSIQAPWMEIAIREAKQWHGTGERNIEDNYHKLAGSHGKLSNTPWCASFVTYCLAEANYHHARANAQSSQFPVNEPARFYEISEPVYGAIMVMRNYSQSTNKFIGGGHISFVYSLTTSGNIAALGGNQGGIDFGYGTIKLSEYPTNKNSAEFDYKYQKFYKFYLPVGYYDNKNKLRIIDIDEENATNFGIGIQSNSNEGGGL